VASYSLSSRPSVEKDLASLPKHVVSRILDRFEKLKGDPFSAKSRKLQGAERLYRIRVGDYRIVYEVDTRALQIIIQYVRHRREVYRNL
jgi:mRNA interferase RelE/StbE